MVKKNRFKHLSLDIREVSPCPFGIQEKMPKLPFLFFVKGNLKQHIPPLFLICFFSFSIVLKLHNFLGG